MLHAIEPSYEQTLTGITGFQITEVSKVCERCQKSTEGHLAKQQELEFQDVRDEKANQEERKAKFP